MCADSIQRQMLTPCGGSENGIGVGAVYTWAIGRDGDWDFGFESILLQRKDLGWLSPADDRTWHNYRLQYVFEPLTQSRS